MTRNEYERIQEMLSARMHANPHAGGIDAARKEGILLAKTALGEWYHDHCEDDTASTNRVLTLDEVREHKAVWIEDDGCEWGDDNAHAALYVARANGYLSMFYSDSYYSDEEETYLNNEEYGVTWRCWLRKPTEDEMKNTPLE